MNADDNRVLEKIYNQRYKNNYRKNLDGFEYSRWNAIDKFINNKVNSNSVNTVLDYGCGNGLHIKLWEKKFPKAQLYFTDISSIALKQLISKYPEYKNNVKQIKNEIAPFEDNSYDVIVSVEVMEHVSNLHAYLKDIYRLLNMGGAFIWTTPCANKFSIEHIYNLITKQIIHTKEGYLLWKWEDPTHLRRLKSGEIEAILTELGYIDIGFEFRAHLFSFICTRIFRKRMKSVSKKIMLLDYLLFKNLKNGASMIGIAKKPA